MPELTDISGIKNLTMEHLIMKYIQPSFFENKVLPLLSFLYTDTMYGNQYDFYRIKDVLDQFSHGQFLCKQWAVDEIQKFIEPEDSIVVIGGWYGLMSHMLAESGFTNEILDYEIDSVCIDFHDRLKVHNNVSICHQDGFEMFDDKELNGKEKIIICTACEHIDEDDLYEYMSIKNPYARVLLQSNNMHNIASHINCHESIDHFIDTLPEMNILYKGTKKIDDYERYMVIAK